MKYAVNIFVLLLLLCTAGGNAAFAAEGAGGDIPLTELTQQLTLRYGKEIPREWREHGPGIVSRLPASVKKLPTSAGGCGGLGSVLPSEVDSAFPSGVASVIFSGVASASLADEKVVKPALPGEEKAPQSPPPSGKEIEAGAEESCVSPKASPAARNSSCSKIVPNRCASGVHKMPFVSVARQSTVFAWSLQRNVMSACPTEPGEQAGADGRPPQPDPLFATGARNGLAAAGLETPDDAGGQGGGEVFAESADGSGAAARAGRSTSVFLTLDACGGKADTRIIALLREHRVPAAIFVTNKWLRGNAVLAAELAGDPLFTLEAHGTRHKPASVNGRAAYGITGTASIADLVSEVEENARAIAKTAGRRPLWYRSGTAFYDEVALEVIHELGLSVAGYSISADAGATLPGKAVARNMLAAKDGDILLCHMNHPESGTYEGLRQAIPKMLEDGVRFVALPAAGK